MNNLTPLSSSTSTPLPVTWIEKLLHQMLLTYGKKFTDQWGATSTDQLVAFWGEQLAGYSGAEIKRGLDALSTRDWPPTLPEFKKLCRSALDPLVAYYEAVAGVQARAAGEFGKWSHPAIYWAAVPLSFDLQAQAYSQIKPRWERAFFEQMDKAEWEPVPNVALQLSAPGKSEPSREEAQKLLASLKATFVVKKPGDKIDHRAWAKRILEREASGDTSVSVLQLKFAKEAMATTAEA